jgi:osmotically inducible protein OsmC
MAVRNAKATWEGTLQEGTGTMHLGSGAYTGKFSYRSRFEDEPATNPEELLGAALAGCFSMSLGSALGKAGTPAKKIETEAQVHLTKGETGFSITRIELTTVGEVPGIDQNSFVQFAENAKNGCIVSRALGNVEITVAARLKV